MTLNRSNLAKIGAYTVFLLAGMPSAILLLIPGARFYNAALLAGVMTGAVIIHVVAGEYAATAFAGALLSLAAVLAWAARPRYIGQAACVLPPYRGRGDCAHPA